MRISKRCNPIWFRAFGAPSALPFFRWLRPDILNSSSFTRTLAPLPTQRSGLLADAVESMYPRAGAGVKSGAFASGGVNARVPAVHVGAPFGRATAFPQVASPQLASLQLASLQLGSLQLGSGGNR